jgi:SAM (Sterile alpha motif) domain-containing protein
MRAQGAIQTVMQWPEQVGLPQYAEAFERKAVDLKIARDLKQQDLRDLDLEALGHHRLPLSAIAELRGLEASFPRAPGPGAKVITSPVQERAQLGSTGRLITLVSPKDTGPRLRQAQPGKFARKRRVTVIIDFARRNTCRGARNKRNKNRPPVKFLCGTCPLNCTR